MLPFALGLYAMYVVDGVRASTRAYRVVTRSFYGQLEVRDDGEPGTERASRTLVHGGIIHGTQWQDDARRPYPTTYYCETSGVGRAIDLLPKDRGRRVGVVGLGAGTLVAFGRPGDVYRVYEINPLVIRLAETEFTFSATRRPRSPSCSATPGGGSKRSRPRRSTSWPSTRSRATRFRRTS